MALKVAVIRGGATHAYESSMRTGEHVLSLLRDKPEVYVPLDIFISKDGEWHKSGLVYEPHQALKYSDVVWNALHGSHRDDERVEKLLERIAIPFVGSRAISSVASSNKDMAKGYYRSASVFAPKHELLTREDLSDKKVIEIFRSYMHPFVIKSVGKASFGKKIARSFNELKAFVRSALELSPRIMVEEFVPGRAFTCAVIENAKGEELYATLPFSLSGDKISAPEARNLEDIAGQIHQALGMRHYSMTDFVITPKGKIYAIETDSNPELHEDSLLHKALLKSNWEKGEFVDHVIKLAV